MRKGQFVEYMESVSLVDATDMDQLFSLVEQFPYSAALQKVVLKLLRDDGDVRYDERLALVASVVRDRKMLHDYLYEERCNKTSIVQPAVALTEAPTLELEDENEKEPIVSSPSLGIDYFEDITYSTEDFVLEAPKGDMPDVEQVGQGARTFNDWLKFMEDKKEGRAKADVEDGDEVGQWGLINSFIKEQPVINSSLTKEQPKPVRKEVEQSNQENEEFMTETLAQIYIKQKHYEKAIKIFEKLSLKYPEKNTYFAGQIKLIGQLKNNEKE